MRTMFGPEGYLSVVRQRVFTAVEALLFALIIGVLMMVFVQVFARYVLRTSTPWTDNLSQILLVWVVMIGAAVAMERKEHYAITVIIDRIPCVLRAVVLLAANMLGVAFLLLLMVLGWEHFQAGFGRSYLGTGLPRAVTYLALPVGAALMAFSMISQSLELLTNKVKPQIAVTRNARMKRRMLRSK